MTLKAQSFSTHEMNQRSGQSILETLLNKAGSDSNNKLATAYMAGCLVPSEINSDNEMQRVLLDKMCQTRRSTYLKAFPHSDQILNHEQRMYQLVGLPYAVFGKK